MFSTKEITKPMINKIIKKWKQQALKMKPINENIITK